MRRKWKQVIFHSWDRWQQMMGLGRKDATQDFECENDHLVGTENLGPVIFRFKKSNFLFQKKLNSVSIPFHYWQGWIRKKVRWTGRQNGTISAVNWRKITQLAR